MTELIFDILEPIERMTVFTPLGIRFWDPVRDIQVRDHLTVTARPAITHRPISEAFLTTSGIYAFQGLPGLHDIEYPIGELTLETSPPHKKYFHIEVKDEQQRFLPAVFGVELPLDYRGIFLNGISSLTEINPSVDSPPLGGPPGFCLFSAPTRFASPGLAAVRSCLVEYSTLRPAAYAMLEIHIEDQIWYGIADERGCVAVLFPYPVFISISGLSPPDTFQILPLHEQHWEFTIKVRYSPDTLIFPFGKKRTPDLRSICDQSPGVIWPSQPQSPLVESPVSEWVTDLTFGQELVLRTDDLPELWIDAAASPP